MNRRAQKVFGVALAVQAIASSLLASGIHPEWGKYQLRALLKNGSGILLAGSSIATDSACNFWVSGYHTNRTGGANDRACFLAKYDVKQTLLWGMVLSNAWNARVTTGTGRDFFVAGTFQGEINLGLGSFASRGYSDVFLARCDSSGKFIWMRQAGGPGIDTAYGAAANAAGECVLAGEFANAAVVFENTTLEALTGTNGNYNLFLAKYDANGRLLWAKRDGGGSAHVRGCAFDSEGNILVTGDFYFSTHIGTHQLSAATGQNEMFLAKYDPSGKLLWVVTPGGPGSRLGYNVAMDSTGSPHVVGITRGIPMFGGKPIPNESADHDNLFLAKYTDQGEFQWVRQFHTGDFDFSNVLCLNLANHRDGRTAGDDTMRRPRPSLFELIQTVTPGTNKLENLMPVVAAVQGPVLRLRMSGAFAVLSWSKEFADYVLEATDSVSPFPVWEEAGAKPESIGDEVSVVLPVDRAMNFYRLRKP